MSWRNCKAEARAVWPAGELENELAAEKRARQDYERRTVEVCHVRMQ